MNIRLVVIATAIAMIVPSSVQARTDEREKVEILYETTLNLIHLLVEQGVIKQEVADEMNKKAEQKAAKKVSEERSQEKPGQAEAGEPKKGEVRVTYVPEHIKKEIRDQLRQEVVGQAKQERWGDVNAVPEWISRFTMDGGHAAARAGRLLRRH